METKTPTLEEVKEYFKNAKEVKCLCNGEIYSTKAMIEDFYYHESTGWWFDVLLFKLRKLLKSISKMLLIT